MPTGSGTQPSSRQAVARMTSWGPMWKAETIIEATGNISRGTAIFDTRPLLRRIERVPALNVSVKNTTTMSPANMCTPKFSMLRRPMITPMTT
jgi:hypothetical protein